VAVVTGVGSGIGRGIARALASTHSRQILGPGVPDVSARGVAVNYDQIRALIPMERRGTIGDIAAAVCFPASDEAGHVTGHSLVVDGGWRAR